MVPPLGSSQIIVSEVEAAVEAEPGLDDEEKEWLRASVYDVYDLLVVRQPSAGAARRSPLPRAASAWAWAEPPCRHAHAMPGSCTPSAVHVASYWGRWCWAV